eukprot:Opistho-2@38752
MRQCPQSSHASTWPPSAAVRHCSIADMTLSCWRLRCPAWAARYAGPALRKISATSSEVCTGSAGRRFTRHQGHQPVERPGDGMDRSRRHLGIERGRLQLAVAKQDLDHADIDVLLEQMRREAMAQGVRADALADAGDLGGFLNRAMQLPGRDRIGATAPRKQPAMGQHDVASLALAPPHPEQLKQLRREHGIAVLASLALLDADQHAGAVDIIDLEVRDLRHTQPRAIGDTERGLVLDPRRCFQQLRRFIDTEHIGQLARITRDDER